MIRAYKNSDKEKIEEIINNDVEGKEALGEYGSFNFEYKKDDYNTIFVSEENNEIQGFIYIHANPATRKILVRDLYISPNHRKKGLGKELLKKSEYFCELYDTKIIQLNVLSFNDKVIPFYEKNGFKIDCKINYWTWYKGGYISNYQLIKIYDCTP